MDDHNQALTAQRCINIKDAQKRPWRLDLRKTFWAGFLTALTVLILNVSLLFWILTQGTRQDGGEYTLVRGSSCTTTSRVLDASALVINLISTLLLGASNNCAQYLSSPTRAEVDYAHTRGAWLDIGVPSVRNIFYISRIRSSLWLALLVSSAPLHLLWNSVLYSVTSANDYIALVVRPDFNQREHLNLTNVQERPGFPWSARNLHDLPSLAQGVIENLYQKSRGKNNEGLTRLEDKDCILNYGTDNWERDWGNVLLVSNDTSGPDINGYFTHAAGNLDGGTFSWICPYLGEVDDDCNIKELAEHSTFWNLTAIGPCNGDKSNTCFYSSLISYCLADKALPHCKLNVSRTILITVIVCNLVKTFCIGAALWLGDFGPLATIGDAISSFMGQPDGSTIHLGPVSSHDVRRGIFPSLRHHRRTFTRSPWQAQRQFWYSAASCNRWYVSSLLFLTVLVPAILPLVAVTLGDTFLELKSTGFGFTSATTSSNLIISNTDYSPTTKIIIANSFQICVSFLYLFYNNLFTCMLLSREINNFSDIKRIRKVLRTSFPGAGQRPAYYLQLPFRYTIPMMLAISLLHFLISRSMFLVQVDQYDISGHQYGTISSVGFSQFGTLVSICFGVLMLMPLYACGFRRYKPGMPIIGSCSVAISAACHTLTAAQADVGKPIAYGVLAESTKQYCVLEYPRFGWMGTWRRSARSEICELLGRREVEAEHGNFHERYLRVGFSALEVTELQEGQVYNEGWT